MDLLSRIIFINLFNLSVQTLTKDVYINVILLVNFNVLSTSIGFSNKKLGLYWKKNKWAKYLSVWNKKS